MELSNEEAKSFAPASAILQELHEKAPADRLILSWLMASLRQQSFGLILLLSAIVAVVPGIAILGGLLLLVLAFQMVIGRSCPVFPNWIASRPLPTRHLHAVVERTIPLLRRAEKVIYPRWPTPPGATKRIVGAAVLLLSARLLLNPIPLSNVLPAGIIGLISLAYLEQDGLVLLLGLLAGVAMLGVDMWAASEMIHSASAFGLPI